MAVQTSSVSDRLGWMRQLLRWIDGNGGGATSQAVGVVPESVRSDAEVLARFGLVRLGGGVVAEPWKPRWLEHHGRSVDQASILEPRRIEEGGEVDPFISGIGYDQYRGRGQRGAMRAVVTAPPGSTLLAVLPTGAGKSLLIHAPCRYDSGLTVVIVPTVALALDQARAIESASLDFLGDPPYAYLGTRGSEDLAGRNELLRRRIRDGSQRIIFTSPEAACGSLLESLLESASLGRLSRLVLDEAHLVESWGEDFRPAFQQLAGLRRRLRRENIALRTLLLSATITRATFRTLEDLFADDGELPITASVALRPEPDYWATRAASEIAKVEMVEEAIHHLPRPLIVYSTIPADAHHWYGRLRELGFRRIGVLTGATSGRERESLVSEWSRGMVDIVCATSAFGMGIDQPHVRSIVHATLPESLDRYYQEVGRAGRDGRASVSVLVHTDKDLKVARGLARPRVLQVETALGRWTRLFRFASAGDGGSSTKDATGSPQHEVDITVGRHALMRNKKNEYWNLRTLTMMDRVGLAYLLGPIRGDEEATKLVKLELPDAMHLESAEWHRRVDPFRRERARVAREGLEVLREMLSSDRCWAESLRAQYSLRRALPTSACGGCPVCRANGLGPYQEMVVEAGIPWQLGLNRSAPDWLRDRFVHGVEYETPMTFSVRDKIRQLTKELLYLGFSGVAAYDGMVDCVPEQRGLPPIIDARNGPPIGLDLPTVVLHTDTSLDEGSLQEVDGRIRVVVFPRGARDPVIPHRTASHRVVTRSLDAMLRAIRSGNVEEDSGGRV